MPHQLDGSDALSVRMQIAEQEIEALRAVKHEFAGVKTAFQVKFDTWDYRLAQIRADVESGRVDHRTLVNRVTELHDELAAHKQAYLLKISEYDRERKVAGGILKPIVIFVLLGLTGGVIALLVKLYVMFGTK